MACHFNIVAWGEAFTDLLLQVVLPNQLTPGNLGSLQGRLGCRYQIYTRPQDAARIKAAPAMARLAATIATELIEVPGLGTGPGAPYDDMTRCHRHAIATAERHDAAMIFLPGDAIWSEGSFRRLLELDDAGCSAVLVAGIRLSRDGFVDAFKARFRTDDGLVAVAPPRELVDCALPHLHPLTRAACLDAANFISFPSQLIAPVEGGGLLLRAFHLHPALIRPQVKGVDVGGTIDLAYLRHACPDPASIHIVEDSDELLQVAVDDAAHRAELIGTGRLGMSQVAAFAEHHADAQQRRIFLDRTIRIHADGGVGPRWDRAAWRMRDLGERLRAWLPPDRAVPKA